MTFSTLPWYIARSAGLVAWALLTASVVWGLLMSTKAPALGRRPRKSWMLDLHRYLGGLATIFTGVHIAGVVADSYLHFGWLATLVPFASTWRPAAIAWGVVGLWLLVAVELTSLARRRLPRRLWRAVHLASFPLFLTATAHAVTAGTDAGTWLFQGVVVVAVVTVAGLTGLRVRQAVEPTPVRPVVPRPAPAPTATHVRERVPV
jgi:predicted ferric reductase